MKNKKKSSAALFGFALVVFTLLLLVSEIAVAVINSVLADSDLGAYSTTLVILPVFSLAVTGFVVYLYYLVNVKSSTLVESLERVAHGDYTTRIEIKKGDSFANVYENFNKMTRELTSVKTLREGFIHDLSHEIKTPLCSIQGFASLLLEGGATEEESRRYLTIIANEAERLRNYAEGVLALSKLEHQEVAGESKDVRLDMQLRECVVTMQRSWEGKGIEVALDLEPVTAKTDGEMLRHVWTNLLENAIKFTPENGKIAVGLKRVNGFAEVTVRDSGVGVPEGETDKIFEKYYRAGNAAKTRGSGIGLAVCKRICVLLNGEITCKSKLGEGSEFKVKLKV